MYHVSPVPKYVLQDLCFFSVWMQICSQSLMQWVFRVWKLLKSEHLFSAWTDINLLQFYPHWLAVISCWARLEGLCLCNKEIPLSEGTYASGCFLWIFFFPLSRQIIFGWFLSLQPSAPRHCCLSLSQTPVMFLQQEIASCSCVTVFPPCSKCFIRRQHLRLKCGKKVCLTLCSE